MSGVKTERDFLIADKANSAAAVLIVVSYVNCNLVEITGRFVGGLKQFTNRFGVWEWEMEMVSGWVS